METRVYLLDKRYEFAKLCTRQLPVRAETQQIEARAPQSAQLGEKSECQNHPWAELTLPWVAARINACLQHRW